jgi:16S rRNA processing protein RimM
MSQPNRVELGRIVGAHALRGEVRVRIFGDGPQNLLSVPQIWLAEAREAVQARPAVVVGAGSGRVGEVRLALEGVETRNAAEALKGLLVLAEAADLARLEGGEFYWHELVGCQVETSDGRSIGSVREIWESGAHDVLVVDAGRGAPVLIPTAREIMTGVDLESRRIVIDDLPGLLED